MAQTLPPAPANFRVRRPLGGRIAGGVALVAVALGIWWASTQQSTITRKSAEDSVLIPVVPPPPPPPPEQPKPVEKPEEVPPQPTPQQPQPTPQQPNPSPQAAPNPGQAVSINGPAQAGGDAFNIGSGPGGGMTGGGRIGNALGGFNRAGYASYLEGEVRHALEQSKELRTAALRARVQAWIDKSGRITRVEVGNTDKADAIRDALTGLSVRAPDASLAMPVTMSLDMRRPG